MTRKAPKRASDPGASAQDLLRYALKHPDAVADNPALPLLSLEIEKPEVQTLFITVAAKKFARIWRSLEMRARCAVYIWLLWNKDIYGYEDKERWGKPSLLDWLYWAYRYNRTTTSHEMGVEASISPLLAESIYSPGLKGTACVYGFAAYPEVHLLQYEKADRFFEERKPSPAIFEEPGRLCEDLRHMTPEDMNEYEIRYWMRPFRKAKAQ